MHRDHLFRRLNELDIRIDTPDVAIPFEWFHIIRRDDFCNTKWHTHHSVEMHCILEGTDEFSFENDSVRLKAGQCLLIPEKFKHHRVHIQDESLMKYSLNFRVIPKTQSAEVSFLAAAFQTESWHVFDFPENAQKALDTCLQEAVERKSGFMTMIHSQLLYALYAFAREIAEYPKANYEINTRRVINDERYKMIEEYILRNMDKQISVAQLEEYMNLSAKQLGRIIASSSDHSSVSALILQLRMERAKALLQLPEISIAEVATQTGFSTEYYFSRVFKQEVGLPPGRWRKSLRGQ